MSGRRNRWRVEAWKATQPQYERRAKRKLLHRILDRAIFAAWKRHRRRIWERSWQSIWDGMHRHEWRITGLWP